MSLPLSHIEVELHLVCGNLDGRATILAAATTRALAGRLSENVQQVASVSQASVSFLHLDGKSGDQVKKNPSCVHVADRTSEPTLTPMGISFDDTKLDPSDRLALYQRRFYEVPRCRRRHSRGTKGSEMHATFHMRKDQ